MQEYERAVIFRLGRLLAGGSRGPGKLDQHNLLIISGHNYLDTKCSSDHSRHFPNELIFGNQIPKNIEIKMHNEKFRGPKEMKKLLRLRLTNYMPNNYVSLSRNIFRSSMHRVISKGGSAYNHIRCSTSGGTLYKRIFPFME